MKIWIELGSMPITSPVIDNYDTEYKTQERMSFRPCTHEGCSGISPLVYLASHDRKEEFPFFAFYILGKDLTGFTYNVSISPTEVFFLGFKMKLMNELSRLTEKSINQILGYEVISNAGNIQKRYSDLIEIFTDGIEKKLTFCSEHSKFAPKEAEMASLVISELTKKFPRLTSMEIEVKKVGIEQKIKYSTEKIKEGKASDYNIIE